MENLLRHKGTVKLETDRLILRPLTVDDSQKVFENWTNDDEVSRFMRWNKHTSVEVTRAWLSECEANHGKSTFYDWGIILKENNEPIGSIGALINENEPDRYEVGYGLGRNYWNNGYATEALRRIMGFLTNEVGIKRFVAMHAHQNPASGAVMTHMGFAYVKDSTYQSFDGLKNYTCKVYYLDVEG
jgi:ribosomal-protein-alanine N-acetyltransferase